MRSRVVIFLLLASCSSSDRQDAASEEKVTFKGSDAIKESDLRELIVRDLRRYEADPRSPALDDAAYRMEYEYRLLGFDRVQIRWRLDGPRIVFEIEEGPQVRLGQVRFEGATVFTTEELRQLVPGRFLGEPPPYSLRLVLQVEEGMIAAYRDRGYVDAVKIGRASCRERVESWGGGE